jgi:putative ABC transport system substrate-binding protein
LAVWPFASHAQQPAKLPTIGFLVAGTPSSHGRWTAAFVQRLSELGWIDTAVIPIVFAAAGDPVGTGLVTSLARPGGNVTGLSLQLPDLAGKRLELLRETVPGLGRLAVLGNIGGPAVLLDMRQVQAAARVLGLEVIKMEIRSSEDIPPAFEAVRGRAQALPATSNRHRQSTHRADRAETDKKAQMRAAQAGRMTIPSGTIPSCTSRHKATRSLRARATIMVLRVHRAFSVR